jgi:hypothetical protein
MSGGEYVALMGFSGKPLLRLRIPTGFRRVARHELPWVIVQQTSPTATRLRPFRSRPRRVICRNVGLEAEWVKELKRVSNIWLKERSRDYADFEWQGGYADFSVSQSNLEQVEQYIANQDEHHRKIGFQDELRALLRKHEIEWDEKYVWD